MKVNLKTFYKTQQLLDTPAPKAIPVPLRQVEKSYEVNIMKPVEPEVLDLLNGLESGATERYLHERYKKSPEEKFVLLLLCSAT